MDYKLDGKSQKYHLRQVEVDEKVTGYYNYASNQQDETIYRLIYYYSQSALRVSGDVFAHHQERLTVFTAYGSIHSSRCRLVSWTS